MIRFDQLSEDCAARFEVVLQAKHRHRDRARFGSGQANHADPSAAGRSGDGDDGVIKIQED